MVAGIALLLSLFLAETALPFLPKIFGKPIAVTSLFQWTTLGWLLLLLLITGVGAGLYPSLYLASYEPTKNAKRDACCFWQNELPQWLGSIPICGIHYIGG